MKHFKVFFFACLLTIASSCGQQKNVVTYQVQQGETMRSIAKKFAVKTKVLRRLNPGIGRRPAVASFIQVPSFKNTLQTTESSTTAVVDSVAIEKAAALEALRKIFVVHTVQKGETFYSLTRFYNLSTANLVALNPVLSEGLKTGQHIKIRAKTVASEEVNNAIYQDTIAANTHLSVAMLLPFRAQEYDTLTANAIFKNNKLVNLVTDYYLGASIAIDSLRKQGVSIDVQLFDTGRKLTKIDSIAAVLKEQENIAVVLGPFYSEEAQFLASEITAPVIFPMYSKNQHTFSETNLIKMAPSKHQAQAVLTTYLQQNHVNENIILVGDGKPETNAQIHKFRTLLATLPTVVDIHVLAPEEGYIKQERFAEIFSTTVNNWVVLLTDDVVAVPDAINSLISLPEETTVKVFSLTKGRAFTKIENNLLAKIGFTYVTNEFIDEQAAGTLLFNKIYQAKNHALPSADATKGFDSMYDVLMRLSAGGLLEETFAKGASYRLESTFRFRVAKEASVENIGLFIVQYNPDVSLLRLQ